ncbi:MAG: hypothetical protein C0478_14190 [Planctomyces sp.]|nr:hypothetical protein [Planctomyces sp.]
MPEPSDPRVYFAAERTLLAWIRTALAIIGLGFVVARFGVFLQVLAGNHVFHPSIGSWLGLMMIAIGALSLAVAAWQHLRFVKTLTLHERPAAWAVGYVVSLALSLSIVSILLAVYLALSPLEPRPLPHGTVVGSHS